MGDVWKCRIECNLLIILYHLIIEAISASMDFAYLIQGLAEYSIGRSLYLIEE